MTKPDSKALADAAIVLLREMFGEGLILAIPHISRATRNCPVLPLSCRAAQMPQWFASMICWTTFPQKM